MLTRPIYFTTSRDVCGSNDSAVIALAGDDDWLISLVSSLVRFRVVLVEHRLHERRDACISRLGGVPNASGERLVQADVDELRLACHVVYHTTRIGNCPIQA